MPTQSTIWSRIDIPPLIDLDERYADRIAAGRQLARLLLPDHDSRALVLALPPGGVVVAGEVARTLRLSLDVLVAREIAIRPYPALVAGALSEGGGLCLNRAILRLPGASLAAVWCEARRAAREIASLVALYRPGRPLPPLRHRSVILVDGGLGDALVQLAAIRVLRRLPRCALRRRDAVGHSGRLRVRCPARRPRRRAGWRGSGPARQARALAPSDRRRYRGGTARERALPQWRCQLAMVTKH